jgi:hypothetical protein
MERTYDTLIRIHSAEEERRDLVLLQVETNCCQSAPEARETICVVRSFFIFFTYLFSVNSHSSNLLRDSRNEKESNDD